MAPLVIAHDEEGTTPNGTTSDKPATKHYYPGIEGMLPALPAIQSVGQGRSVKSRHSDGEDLLGDVDLEAFSGGL